MTSSKETSHERHVLWHRSAEPGLEHFHLREDGGRVDASGLLVGLVDGHPTRLRYSLRCEHDYRFTALELDTELPAARSLRLSRASDGTWRGDEGALPALAGCSDIDLSVSPSTNTLPIRRLRLEVGQTAEIQVAFIELPAFDVRPEPQRYTLLERSGDGERYRFEHLANGYSVELWVDGDGLVRDYPGLFRRAYP